MLPIHSTKCAVLKGEDHGMLFRYLNDQESTRPCEYMMYIIEELYPKLTICIDREDAVQSNRGGFGKCIKHGASSYQEALTKWISMRDGGKVKYN